MVLKEDEDGLVERREILQHWELGGKSLLDIGVGPLSIIAARDFNCRVTNIDISVTALKNAERDARAEGVADRIHYELGDATALRYDDASFDAVISYGALHHIEPGKRNDFVEEVYRVAREMVIIAELNDAGFMRIHGGTGEFQAVDTRWLERKLRSCDGLLDKYTGTAMTIYVLQK